MSDTIRWGILGAASFAQRIMAPAIHSSRGATLAGLATSSSARAAPFAELAPGLTVFESYEALIESPDIDAVYVPLPNHLHADWTERCLAAGKPVLTEKPVGMSTDEIDRLIAVRDETGLLAAEAFMIVHHPQWQRARALIADGAIGELIRVEGAFSYNNTDPANIRNQSETGGGGLRDIGVYPIGAARLVTGAEPTLHHAWLAFENGVDIHAEATCGLGPARFHFRVSMRASLWQEMVFHGATGVLRLPSPFNPPDFGPARIEVLRAGGAAEIESFFADRHYKLQVEAFGHSLRTGAPYPVPLEFSRGTQTLIDEIFARAAQ